MTSPTDFPVELDAKGQPVLRGYPAPTGNWPIPAKFNPADTPMPPGDSATEGAQ